MLRRIADVLISDRLVMAVILLNTAALFLVESVPARSPEAVFWHWVDYGCVVFFLVEAGLKIRRWGWRRYWRSGWDRFDFILVVLSLPVLATPLMGSLEVFANVLVLRVGRLFRLFRLLRFIPNADHLVAGIGRSLRASVGVFLALFLVNFIFAMGATILFGHLGEIGEEAFGTPVRSSYTLFKVFTVEGWHEIPDALAEACADGELDAEGRRLDPTTVFVGVRLYFVLSVLVGGILGLSLANAVFVDQMMMDNTYPLESKVDALALEIRGLRDQLAQDGEPRAP